MILAKGFALFLPPIINHVMLSGPNFPALVKYNFGHDFSNQNMIHLTKNQLDETFNLLTRTRTWTLSELFVCTCHCFQTDKVKQDKMNLDKLYIILKV